MYWIINCVLPRLHTGDFGSCTPAAAGSLFASHSTLRQHKSQICWTLSRCGSGWSRPVFQIVLSNLRVLMLGVAGEGFIPFYPLFMNGLVMIIRNAISDQERIMRGRAMEVTICAHAYTTSCRLRVNFAIASCINYRPCCLLCDITDWFCVIGFGNDC